ncbi:L-2-hydroxyglutarate oxidase [Saccharobesus litoralis]|uniref:L-2-hydroxyglutarate oxidase n=1 Tax=Saccharobesus litoralis TaxID=2172099 RepID=A0A2S0VSX4_9ALTE|nr:L-2-hydroxyglutarate oxidase [Saccharobesus litoralis]AWB67200.1 L-2-hydroxyglutarate oxidase [Saccharobesus litoralis]
MPDNHLFDADVIIVGGGIVGAATALQLKQQQPKLKILLLEKEPALAKHQTGRNSGVIHAGVYYQPGSLKAQFCKQGSADIKQFCHQHDIPFNQCGKLIVATNSLELVRLKALAERCQKNQLAYQWLESEELAVREPNITGLAALLITDTAIVDYTLVTQAMMEDFVEWGGEYWLDCKVQNINELSDCVEVFTSQGRFKTRYLICCAGVMADRLAQMAGLELDFQIVPFRGEYYRLDNKHNQVVKHLIYPVPDPDLPFLGIHLTRMIDGTVTVGPNAVLGWKREGYKKFNFSWQDTKQIIGFKGFWKVLGRYYRSAYSELMNTWFKVLYLKQVKKYCPSINKDDLLPYPTGIRAQAVSQDGQLIHDFLFKNTQRTLHVCNAPSPAATSSMPIGRHIISELNKLIQNTQELKQSE